MAALALHTNPDATWSRHAVSWILLFRTQPIALPMILLRVSPTPICRTPGYLLSGIRLQATKAPISNGCIIEVASFLVYSCSLSSLLSLVNLLLTRMFLYCLASNFDVPAAPSVLHWYCQSMYFEIRWWVRNEEYVDISGLDLGAFLRVLLYGRRLR